MNRRTFHLSFIHGLSSLIGVILAIPASIYLLFPPRVKKQQEWVEAGNVSQLFPEAPEEWVFRHNRVDGWKVTSERTAAWVVKKSNQEVVAFGPQCPHLGCAYHWEVKTQAFLCPCHNSTFSIEGEVLTGPAPRALDRYEIKVEGEKLFLGAVRNSEGKAS
ncbi:MAG: Rieske (2Fe-2S) protein [Acidobacteria bacterium]|nr:Rieske (2Fe-2S) protein [Acidobacteriota bacterium]